MSSPTTSFREPSRFQSVGSHAIRSSKTSTRRARSSGGFLRPPDPFTTPPQRAIPVAQQRRCPGCSRSLRGPPIRGPPSSRPLPLAAEPNVRAPPGLGESLRHLCIPRIPDNAHNGDPVEWSKNYHETPRNACRIMGQSVNPSCLQATASRPRCHGA